MWLLIKSNAKIGGGGLQENIVGRLQSLFCFENDNFYFPPTRYLSYHFKKKSNTLLYLYVAKNKFLVL